MLDYYKSLPDYMNIHELEVLFNKFLDYVETEEYNREEALESLLELADRQWHTYELLDKNTKNRVEAWLTKINDFNSKEVVEYITLIIARLGLTNIYQIIKDKVEDNLRKEVRQIIIETIKEIDGHVEDPYYGMK